MESMLLRLFQQQAFEQCKYALMSLKQLDNKIAVGSFDDVFWRELQALVVSTANISKLFWGTRGKFADQRQELRASIGIKDSSPLRPTSMRNHFEHVDERLDKWWAESRGRNHVDRLVSPPNTINGLEEMEFFRQYDPYTGIASFWGDVYNLREIHEELEHIYWPLEAEVQKPLWDS